MNFLERFSLLFKKKDSSPAVLSTKNELLFQSVAEQNIFDSSLAVTQVENKRFQKIFDQLMSSGFNNKPVYNVKMGEHCVVSDSEALLNTGAGPCIILVFHDRSDQQLISGHYPTTHHASEARAIVPALETLEKKYLNKNPTDDNQTIHLPSATEIDQLTSSPLGRSVDRYQKMLEEIRQRIKAGHHVEMYCFGQDRAVPHPERPNLLADFKSFFSAVLLGNLKERFNTIKDALSIGIEFRSIHDFRRPFGTESDVTHIAYIPEKGIFFSVGKILDRNEPQKPSR